MNNSSIYNRLLVLLIAMLTASRCSAAWPTADFYVATNGSDDWSGTASEPNVQQTDGPFATLERARNADRELEKRQSENVIVLIRGGTYRLKKTVVFGLHDSRQGDSTVTYAAYPNETPLFSSGQEISKWTKVTAALSGLPNAAIGNVWVANISDRFLSLFDAEGLLPRARSKGFIPLEGGSRNELHFPKGRLKNWANVDHVGRWDHGKASDAKYANSAIQNSQFTLVNNKELYDLRTDPGETKNIIAEHHEIADKLRSTYDQWWSDVQPLLVNEIVTDIPKINPLKELYWKQFGGVPDAAMLKKMDPANGGAIGKKAATPNRAEQRKKREQAKDKAPTE